MDDKDKVLNSLKAFSFKGENEVIDIYYFDPLRNPAYLDARKEIKEWFRIRSKKGKSYITYKKDIYNGYGKWLYSDEYETAIDDYETAKQIVLHLGLEELIVICNKKYTFETPLYEIVFEEVKDLGCFLEVERLQVLDDEDVQEVKKEIQEFIDSLQLRVSKELSMGKPELMLNKLWKT